MVPQVVLKTPQSKKRKSDYSSPKTRCLSSPPYEKPSTKPKNYDSAWAAPCSQPSNGAGPRSRPASQACPSTTNNYNVLATQVWIAPSYLDGRPDHPFPTKNVLLLKMGHIFGPRCLCLCILLREFFLDLTVLAYHICKKILDIKHLGKPWDWKRARVGGKSRPCAKVIKHLTYIKGYPKCCLHWIWYSFFKNHLQKFTMVKGQTPWGLPPICELKNFVTNGSWLNLNQAKYSDYN